MPQTDIFASDIVMAAKIPTEACLQLKGTALVCSSSKQQDWSRRYLPDPISWDGTFHGEFDH
jgi:hypothetical protein